MKRYIIKWGGKDTDQNYWVKQADGIARGGVMYWDGIDDLNDAHRYIEDDKRVWPGVDHKIVESELI